MAAPRDIPSSLNHYSTRYWVVSFIKFDVKGDVLRIHNDVGNLTLGTEVYEGWGDLVGVSGFDEDGELNAASISFTFNFWSSDLVSAARSETYLNREVLWQMSFVDLATQAPTGDALEIFRGSMGPITADSQAGTITVPAQDDRELLHRPIGKSVEDSIHQAQNKGAGGQRTDKFFSLAKKMKDLKVRVGIVDE